MTLSFWLILLATLLWGLFHSLLASLQVKAHASHWLGPATDRWYRLIYNFIAIISLFPVLLLPISFSDKVIYEIGFPWLLLTLSIQVLAIIVLFIGIKQTGILAFLGLRQIPLLEEPQPASLVTDGLYRYVRHPQFTAGLVIIWLVPLMTWNLLALVLGLTGYILIGIYFEERKHLLEFGNAYTEYRNRTPMLIPGLRLGHKNGRQ